MELLHPYCLAFCAATRLLFFVLCSSSESVGQVAEFVTSVLNTNVHTFGVAPVFATVERACIQGMAKQIGFNPELADGILCPGVPAYPSRILSLVLLCSLIWPVIALPGHQGVWAG